MAKFNRTVSFEKKIIDYIEKLRMERMESFSAVVGRLLALGITRYMENQAEETQPNNTVTTTTIRKGELHDRYEIEPREDVKE